MRLQRLGVLLSSLAVLGATSALAAPSLRYSVEQRGDMVLIGSSLGYDCANAPNPVVGTIGNGLLDLFPCGANSSDTGVDLLWRSEQPGSGKAAANTNISVATARSSAKLNLPTGATVTYARLYWAAEVASEVADTSVTFERPNGFSATVTADDSATASSEDGHFYQSTADVTALVQANGPGVFRVSGVDTLDPRNRTSEVHFAAWSLVVFYAKPSESFRNLTLFDGLDPVESGKPASAVVSGFRVPNTGYDAKLGVIAYEGDSTITGDSLSFNGVKLSDGANPENNFFNSTRSNLGAPVSVAGDLPQMSGGAGSMSGLDLDIVNVTSTLAPGATSATTLASSTQDTYLIGAFVTSISTLKPIFTETVKSATDLNGGVIQPGDVIEYTITTHNTGTDTAINVVLQDPLPSGLTFVPGSLSVVQGDNPGAKTDAAGDDQAEYVAGTRTVVYRLGAGANGTQGGSIPVGGPNIIVRFQATVDASASGLVANQAVLSSTGQLGGQTETFPTSESGTDGEPTVIVIGPDTTILTGPPLVTADPTATFTFGSPIPGATFECELDGASTFTACPTPFVVSSLADGAHTLTVRATYAGEVDETPAVWSWVVDSALPGAPVIVEPTPGQTVHANTVTVAGTAAPNSTVTVYVDGAPATVTADAAGNWSYTPSTLPTGPHTVTATATDAAGNTGATSNPVDFTFDPIDTRILSGPPEVDASSSATFTFASNVAGATFLCSLDGAPFTACASPLTLTGLVNGEHLFAVTADDGSGDVDATPDTYRWQVQAVLPPAPAITQPTEGETVGTLTPTVVGTAQPGTTVSVVIDGVVAGTTTSDAQGSWFFTPSTPLAAGDHTVSAFAQDAAGNAGPSCPSVPFTVDLSTFDTFIVSGPSGLTNQPSATFTFDATRSPVTYQCRLDGQAFTPCANPVTFSALVDGPHQLEVRAEDGDRNLDTSPALRSWTVDTVAPAAPVITAPTEGAAVATLTPTLQGTAEPGATVAVQLDGAAVGVAHADAAGQWSLPLTDPLTPGSHGVDATASDAAGNTSPRSATTHFTVDLSALDTFIQSGPPPFVSSTSATFAFGSNFLTATFECSLDGGAFAACVSPATFTGLGEGSHVLAVRANDGAGVDTSPATWPWTVDTQAPGAPTVESPAAGSTVYADPPPFSGTAEPFSQVTVTVDGAQVGIATADADGHWTLPPSAPLGDGAHTVSATATDRAGNVSPPSTPQGFTVLTGEVAAPTITAPTNGTVVNASTPTVEGTSPPGSTVTVIVDGVPVGTTSVDGNGHWTFTPSGAIPEGTHTVTATTTDGQGRPSRPSAPVTFTVDTTPPDTQILSGPEGAGSETSAAFRLASTEDASTFECSLDGAAFTACEATVVYDSLASGSHVFKARAVDEGGNVDPTPAEKDWEIGDSLTGVPANGGFHGGGCSTTPGGGALWLAVVALIGLLGRRRRRLGASLAVLVAVGVLGTGSAFAQAVPGFDLERLQLNPDGLGSLVLDTGETLPQGRLRIGAALQLEHQPLLVDLATSKDRSVVRNRWTAHLVAAYGITRWLEVGAQLPIVAHQLGDHLAAQGISSPDSAGVGTPWLEARVGVLREEEQAPLDLSARVAVGLPVGSQDALAGDPKAGLDVGVSAGRTLTGWLRAGAAVAFSLRPSVVLGNTSLDDEVGSAVRAGVGLNTVNPGLRGELTLRGLFPTTSSPVSAELLAGARYPVAEGLEVYALAGPGFGQTAGTPAFRVLAGLAFAAGGTEARAAEPVTAGPVCVAGQPHRAADCPQLDDDQDGTANGVDRCPDEAGPKENHGCPVKDADQDGVPDAQDACPAEAGPKENRGCPIKDADQDGVPDTQDACPTTPGPKENGGCPIKDADQDQVPDDVDNCPNEAGPASNHGCPEKKKQLVVIEKDRLQILEKVFFATGKATIAQRSYPLLNQVAQVLNGHPNLAQVEVGGHTDSTGSEAFNTKLSQHRAEAVRAYLIKQGVAPSRLVAKGYGPSKPVASNDTPEGREVNRRVEFNVLPGAAETDTPKQP